MTERQYCTYECIKAIIFHCRYIYETCTVYCILHHVHGLHIHHTVQYELFPSIIMCNAI